MCYLDDESTSVVRYIQEALSDLTGARASLDLWKPHVTVGDGVVIDNNELGAFQRKLEYLARSTKPFRLDLHDILKIDLRKGGEGETTTPYGLYLDVKKNKELIKLVSKVSDISDNLKKWYLMPSPYHPHCALAFKDLPEEGYRLGGDYLDRRRLTIQAKINSISIVEMLPDETKEFAHFNFA